MIVTPMTQFDLTGIADEYKQTGKRFKVFEAGQKIVLNEPVYSSSIAVVKIVNGTSTALERDIAWTTDPVASSRDVNAISAAKIKFDSLDPDEYIAVGKFKQSTDSSVVAGKYYFIKSGTSYALVTDPTGNPSTNGYFEPWWDEEIVNCIYMKDVQKPSPEYTIEVTYQSLELDIKRMDRDGLGPEYSPGLMRSVVEAIDELQSFNSSVANLSNDNLFTSIDTEEDLTGKKPTNRIENEVHYVNVSANKFVIRPCCGSFYPWDETGAEYNLVVEHNGNVLTRGVDYEVVGVNQAKTSVCEPACGVYEFIVIKTNITGNIFITYQAFGGEVSVADINRLAILVENIKRYCDNAELVTKDNIGNIALIRSIIDRLDYIDETIRHYQSQRFAYTTLTDDADKWVNVAFIEQNPWLSNAPVNRTDFGEFRIEIPQAHFSADLRLTYDVDAASGEELSVTVSHSNCKGLDELGYSYFETRIIPKFRIIAIGTTEENLNKGIMLQMSVSRATALECTVIITDRTGAKSPWYLIDTQGESRPVSGDSNTSVTFPNGNVWRNASNFKSNTVTIIPNGYTIFSGAYLISKIEENTKVVKSDADLAGDTVFTNATTVGTSINPMLTTNGVSIDDINYFEFRVWDRYTQQYLVARSQKLKKDANSALVGDALYFTDDLCVVSLELKVSGAAYTGKLYSRTGTNSLLSERFVLTRIDILQ